MDNFDDLRAALGRMTEGELTIERCTRADYHLMDADGACMATVYLYDNDHEARNNATGIVLLKKRLPALLAERDTLAARVKELEGAVTEARDVFRHYGDLHAAKPDPVKAQRNCDLADKMTAALGDAR